MVAPSTARIPPNRLTTPSMSSSGAASFTEHHLLSFAEEPLRTERHQPDQQQSGDCKSERGNPCLSERRVRQIDEPSPLQDEPEQDRAECDTPVAAHAAEDKHAEGKEGDQRLEVER